MGVRPQTNEQIYQLQPLFCNTPLLSLQFRLSVILVSHNTEDAQDDALPKHFPSTTAFLCWNHVLQVRGIVLLSQCYTVHAFFVSGT